MNLKLDMHVTPHQRVYLLLVGNLVALALIGFFAVRPVVGLLVTHTTEITQTKADIASAEDKSAQLRKLKDTLPTYEQTYAPILAGLPKQKDVASYQAELEALAATTGVSLKTVDTSGGSPGNAKKPAVTTTGSFPSVPVTLDVEGSFASVMDYVGRLETMNRFTKVAGIEMKADDAGKVILTLQVQTFYLP